MPSRLLLAVGVVVLVGVADQVAHGEPVVGGDEVDRAPGPPRTAGEDVGGAGEPVGQLAHPGPHPARSRGRRHGSGRSTRRTPGEAADLVTGSGGVPRLGDQLDVGEYRVGRDRRQQRRPRVEPAAPRAAQRAGQVETEPVDAHLARPEPQRVQDQANGVRARRVQGVATPGEILQSPAAPVQVVARRVQAPKAHRRAAHLHLAGVVVDHVEDEPRSPPRAVPPPWCGTRRPRRPARSRTRGAGPGSRRWSTPQWLRMCRARRPGSSRKACTGSNSNGRDPQRPQMLEDDGLGEAEGRSRAARVRRRGGRR